MMHDHSGGQGDLIRSPRFYDLMTTAMTLGRIGAMREAFLDTAQVRAGDRVLDVGCGTGSLALVAKRRVGQSGTVVGIDPSPEMIARARAKADAAGLAIEFHLAPAQQLPFPDASFDVVLSTMMLHHVPDALRMQAVGEMRRVLKPQGRLLVAELTRHAGFFAQLLPRRLLHKHGASHPFEDAKRLVAEAGVGSIDSGIFPLRFAGWVRGRAAHDHIVKEAHHG